MGMCCYSWNGWPVTCVPSLTLIDDHMNYLTDGQMPFEYTQTIRMMIRIAQGMEDLHRCGCIHGDLKASNILVKPVLTKSEVKEVDGSHLDSASTYFDVKIGDFDNCDGVQGTAFWRAPEVLQAVKSRTKPMFSPAVDVYSYAMLCYELLTGHIPLGEYPKGKYDVVLSGQRPELPPHVNDPVKELLHACWHAEPGERPGWTCIIQTLKEELEFHPLVSHHSNRCASVSKYSNSPRILANTCSELECLEIEKLDLLATEEVCMRSCRAPKLPWEKKFAENPDLLAMEEAVCMRSWRAPNIPWEEAFARQLHNPEEEKQFRIWKEKIFPELLPKILPIVDVMREIFNFTLLEDYMFQVSDVWREVEKSWTNCVWRTANVALGNDVVNMLSNASEPCNLLGSTAKQWLEEILATFEEWHTLRQTLRNPPLWKQTLQKRLFAWEAVYITFDNWHFESAIAVMTWQIVDKMYLNWEIDMNASQEQVR